jgi:hypothetical protein
MHSPIADFARIASGFSPVDLPEPPPGKALLPHIGRNFADVLKAAADEDAKASAEASQKAAEAQARTDANIAAGAINPVTALTLAELRKDAKPHSDEAPDHESNAERENNAPRWKVEQAARAYGASTRGNHW